ncbi:MAG: thymidylate synthase [Spirochaetes bacterium]|nr:thymidylate synthase [Spirochaetota bacterium]
MKAYIEIVNKIIKYGISKENRTGIDTLAIPGIMFEHDMSDGYPLITTKSVPFRLVASELEFFIKGITDKKWLQERNNHIWDEWCTPAKVSYGHDENTKKKMMMERDLGPVYGWQWRHFGATYKSFEQAPKGAGIDQLKKIIDKIKKNPYDRRLIVSSWNPVDLSIMALPPCHFCFQVTIIGQKLNLLWSQRSVDVALGLPFNIASYALLLHLLARQTGFEEGKLVGFLADTHIYTNHIDGLKEQIKRKPYALPVIDTPVFKSIFDWTCEDTILNNYQHHPKITFEIAV